MEFEDSIPAVVGGERFRTVISGLPGRAEEPLPREEAAEHGANGNSVALGHLPDRIASDEMIH